MPHPVLIIANPVSGRGRGARLAPRAEARLRELGHPVELAFTSKRGDARALAARAGDFGCVLAVGGDGTVNEILNGLPDAAPPLAQLPIGTANVIAKTFDLPRSARAAADAVHAGLTTPVDVGVANGRRFLLMASAGFDAQVVHDFHAVRKGPIRMHQYVSWSLRAIWSYETPTLRVVADGQELPPASWVMASNLPCYGGPLAFTREARVDDGQLDVLAYAPQGRLGLVRLFAEAFAGDPCAMPGATWVRAKSVRIEGPPAPWQVDGDPGETLPLDISLLPRAIRLVVRETHDAPTP